MIHRSKILHWGRYLIYVLIAIFLIVSLSNGWEQVQQFEWHFSFWQLMLAFILQITYFVGNGLFWIWLVRHMAMPLSTNKGLSIFAVTKLSRYIPGGVWPFASVAALGKQEGLSATRMVASLILTQVLSIWVSGLFSLPVVLIAGVFDSTVFNVIVGGGLVLATVLAPWLLRQVFLWVIEWRKLPDTDAVRNLLRLRLLSFMFLGFVTLHLVQMLSFYTFLTAIIDVSVSDGIYAAFSWSAAWLIGFLVLIVPSGLGVREASLTILLQRIMPTSIATAVGVGHRLFFTTFDLMLLIAFLVLTHPIFKSLQRKDRL